MSLSPLPPPNEEGPFLIVYHDAVCPIPVVFPMAYPTYAEAMDSAAILLRDGFTDTTHVVKFQATMLLENDPRADEIVDGHKTLVTHDRVRRVNAELN